MNKKRPELMCGEIELDESYFGGVRKGKRGRGARGKTPVFGLLKRNGKVHAFPIPNARTETLFQLLGNQLSQIPLFIEISFSAYDVLDVSEFHHERINHSKTIGQKPLWMSTIISMELRTSGAKPSGICVALMASQKSTFTST